METLSLKIMGSICILEENVFVKNIFYAMEAFRKKGKGQCQDNIIDVYCGTDFHLGKKIVTDNLKLTVQINMMWNVVARDRVLYRLVKGKPIRKTSYEYSDRKLFCQNIDKQNLQQPGIFYNYKTGSIEIAKDKLNPTTNSSTHNRINKSSKETTSKKKNTGNTNLKATNKENNNKK